MKKVVISASTSWYLYNFRKNTILSLIESGYRVIAVAPTDAYSTRLQALGVHYIPISIERGGTNPIQDLKCLIDFYRIYKANHVDVVLNFTPKCNIYSAIAANLLGCKVVNNISGLGDAFVRDNWLTKLVKKMYKLSFIYSDKVFFQNHDDRKFFLEEGLLKASQADYVPGSGVDLSRFQVKQPQDQSKTTFLMIARVLETKGARHYAEAAQQIKEQLGDSVEFLLVGQVDKENPAGITEQEIQKWVSQGAVNYLGTTDQIESVIAQADCVVLPSYYREGVPRSLLESGAMGKPIITTEHIGCRDTVDDGMNGFLCQPKSTPSLVDTLSRFIQLSKEQQLQMGLASRHKMEREFDERIVIRKYHDAIEAS